MKKILLLGLVVLFPFFPNAQENEIEKLLEQLKNAKDHQSKITIVKKLANMDEKAQKTLVDLLKPQTHAIEYQRIDFYGHDLLSGDFTVLQNGKPVADPYSLTPGHYIIKIDKPGYRQIIMPLEINAKKITVPITLVPTADIFRKLDLTIADPLCDPSVKLTPDDVRLKSRGISIINRAVRPGKYVVVVSKQGYCDKETAITIGESGTIEEKVTLEYKPRPVRFIIKDYLKQEWLREYGQLPVLSSSEVKLTDGKGNIVDFQHSLMPGYYTFEANRAGYRKFQKQIKVMPGTSYLDYEIEMQLLRRKVSIKANYRIAPENLFPDRVYLRQASGERRYFSLRENFPAEVQPGRYYFSAEKVGYLPIVKEIFIKPESDTHVEQLNFIAVSKMLYLQIISDYPVNPIVRPDSLEIDLFVQKRGYKTIDWQTMRKSLPPRRSEMILRVSLETLPRKIYAEIQNAQRSILIPDTLTLTRLNRSGQKAGPPISLIENNKIIDIALKPSFYELNIRKEGYVPVQHRVLIEPGENPFLLREKLFSQ